MRLLWIGLFCLPLVAADSPEDFRVVDSKLYNVQKSVLWVRLAGWPIGKTNGAIVFRNGRYHPIDPPQVIPRYLGGGNADAGAFSKGHIDAMSGWVTSQRTPLQRGLRNSSALPELIVVRNLTTNWMNQLVTVLAMQVGETNGLQIWDVGVIPKTTNPPTQPKIQAPANRTRPSP